MLTFDQFSAILVTSNITEIDGLLTYVSTVTLPNYLAIETYMPELVAEYHDIQNTGTRMPPGTDYIVTQWLANARNNFVIYVYKYQVANP